MEGQLLSHYTVVVKIGEGGMGAVYRAVDTRLNRTVAIKVLPPHASADPDRKRRFVQEAQSASALNHPNIVNIYEIDSAGGVDFIAMEYVDGESLEKMIAASARSGISRAPAGAGDHPRRSAARQAVERRHRSHIASNGAAGC